MDFSEFRPEPIDMKTHPLGALLWLTLWATVAIHSVASENNPPASPEVTAAMQPYLDSYKLAGFISIIADKTGKIHYKNLQGQADVEAKKPMREDNVFWI